MNVFYWALATALIWGTVPLIEKIGLGNNDPIVGVFARTVGVTIGLVFFSLLFSPWKALGSLGIRSFCLLSAGGILASLVGQATFYHALKSGSVSQVAPLAGTYPLVAALLGWLILREPMTMSRITGACLIVMGIILLRR